MLVGMVTPESIRPIVHLERGVEDVAMSRETSTSGGEFLKDIRFGGTSYKCPSGMRLYYQFSELRWQCWARELGAICVGEGETIKDAREDWLKRFHAEFQRLYSMRPFEMTAEDADTWQSILNTVDVVEYRLHLPLSLSEIGCVRYRKMPYPSQIYWIDGRREKFSLNQVPGELAGCKPGQWIEAIVEREPQSGMLRKIVHVQRIPSPVPENAASIRAAWEKMPTAELEDVDWDWPESI